MLKKLSIIILIVVLAIVVLITTVFVIKNKPQYNNNQTVNMEENKINDITLKNGVEITKGTITYENGKYFIRVTAKNNTDKDIDCSIYRLSFRNINGVEIEFFSGAVIGLVKAQEEVSAIIETTKDISKVTNIYYEEFFMGVN